MTENRVFDGRMLVVAFEGWNDAGDAASDALEHLDAIWEAQPIIEIDDVDFCYGASQALHDITQPSRFRLIQMASAEPQSRKVAHRCTTFLQDGFFGVLQP